MFKQIVSNLSLSPGAGSQLTYYLNRLKKEGITRKLSMVFAVGLVVLQIATVVSPTQASNVPSNNDIVWGGLTSSNPKADMLAIYDQNHDSNGHTGYQNLLKRFGITRAEIEASTVGTINSSDHTLLSLGRVDKFADDQPITVDGVTYYLKPLFEWGDHLTYPSLNGTRADGSFFAIMIDCGNIVVRTVPVQPPKFTFSKTTLPGTPAENAQVPPGTILGYRINFKNVGAGGATKFRIYDPIPAHTTKEWQGTGGMPGVGINSDAVAGLPSGPHAFWAQPELDPGAGGYVDLRVKIQADTPDGTKICNYGYIGSAEKGLQKAGPVCHTVQKAAPPPPPPPPPPGASKIVPSKAVANLTKNNPHANRTMAAAGDVLQYTLTNKNTGNAAAKNVPVDEDLNDVLAYATIEDAGGGKLGANGHLVWPVIASIPAGGSNVKTFKVKVKNPIPSSPSTANDPTQFDLRMLNFYGNFIEVDLPAPLAKTIEKITNPVTPTPETPGTPVTPQQLPQTGSTQTTVIIFFIIAGMVYLYLRNRQLVHELKILRVDNVTGQ